MSSVITAANLDRTAIERVVRDIVRRRLGLDGGPRPEVVVNISARHMHITQADLEHLFGPGAQLTVFRELYQEGQFASEQTVTIIGPRHRTLTNIRILGPVRKANQIELSFTDGIAMGIDLPVRMSGDIESTPGCIVLGPKGHIEMKQGVIRALRHAHMNEQEASYYGIRDGDMMNLHVDSDCALTLEGIVARINPAMHCEVHLDTDEGNAAHLTGARGVELYKA